MITQIILSLFLVLPTHASSSEISGEVTLAKGVVLEPGGVLYVFAKRTGNPMPAAVIRVPAPKFPHKFVLSEKNAMSPGTPFEGPFTVSARYSPSGDAMDKSGPQGSEAKSVAVGAKDVKIELKR